MRQHATAFGRGRAPRGTVLLVAVGSARCCGESMRNEPTVLVVSQENDPQFSLLNSVPHIVGHEPVAFASAASEPVVILAWSGEKSLMRDVFTMCADVRWVHSRSAGVDNLALRRRWGQRERPVETRARRGGRSWDSHVIPSCGRRDGRAG